MLVMVKGATSEKEKLLRVMHLGLDLAQFKDLDVLLERILTLARRSVDAEAGSIYIRDGERLKFSQTQNDLLQKRLPEGRKLIYSQFSLPIDSNSIAGHVALTGRMANIRDVYRMPGDAPYRFGSSYDEVSDYRTRSMLSVPLRTPRGNVVGVIQLINARGTGGRVRSFSGGDELFALHFAASAANAVERAQMTRAVILRVIKMAELRDPKETWSHANRVASYAAEVYGAWAFGRGMPAEEIERDKDSLRMGALLHDVGKVAIPDAILKKPARLEPDEYEIIKRHTYVGSHLFAEQYSDFDEAAAVIALTHHEHWDGNGYPGHVDTATGLPLPGYENGTGGARGKRGEEIHPFGRVVAIADVYDALSSRRAYKDAWDEGRVLETLRQDAGSQFDPEMMQAFLDNLDVMRAITERYPDSRTHNPPTSS